jgi:hypothetical protein
MLEKNLTIKMLVATHKQATMPKDNNLYLPVHVGALGKDGIGYQRDDEGENISHLNPYYSELTGLYWAWKNLDCDYLGLVHYRRFFANKKIGFRENLDIDQVILDKESIKSMLKETDVIVPAKRRYYIQSLYSHYADTHDRQHLDQTREILADNYPEFLSAFDQVMKQTSGYMFNMFIMKKSLVDDYCKWLFPILEELSARIDSSNYSTFDARYLGRVSERLFNVWLLKNQLSVKEVPFIYLEKVDLIRKGKSFLAAKFLKKKYGSSF